MVFYAYAINDTNEENRLLITASSVEVMDAWYRYSRQDGLSTLKRKSPELYTYNYASHHVWHFVYHGVETPKVKGSIFFETMGPWNHNNQMNFLNQHAPDHLSGNAFYIRSKSNPRVFWNVAGGQVFASKVARTKFRINGLGLSKGDVILPEDKITIAAIAGDPLKETTVQWKGDNTFVADAPEVGNGAIVPGGPPNQGPGGYGYGFMPRGVTEFTFSDLKKNFLAVGKHVEEADAKLAWFQDAGEEWELCS
ncbi:hypothetical protein PENFLA_c001G03751 [Penicillium flavigenum]|uniref:Uncharacterized protein n=1 Tax=Penicillium flavigenum TaxID=254877 RepID=A0A1V6U3K8_9EURO|nr:hypothetical protein PENFLA_c001G03751 [Penicillium flavigenum]